MNRGEDATLREYAESGSDRAFATLVSRQFNLVYATALRITNGETHLAQDVTQTVFTDLARKAKSLPRDLLLGGWLYKHTCFIASNAVRKEQRRRTRERQAFEMNSANDESAPAWSRVGPVLDEAMGRLGAHDRDVLVLRFFEQKSLRTVGEALGVSEEAARKRVDRALEKLRGFFARRGLGFSAAVLSSALDSYAAAVGPAELASIIAKTALAEAATGGGVGISWLKLMTITKSNAALTAIAVGMTAVVFIQSQSNSRLQRENGALRQETDQLNALRSENEHLSQTRPTATPKLDENQFRELMRLRGEVGVLKDQLRQAKQTQEAKTDRGTPSTPDDPAEQQKKAAIAKLNYTREWVLAFMMYASDHQQACPTNFDQAAAYWKNDETEGDLTTNQFQVLYQGSFNAVSNLAQTIVIGEIEPVQGSEGGWLKTYGFADGHSEVHLAQDGNFESWESQHTQKPPEQ